MTWVARIALIAAISLVSGCKMIGSEELTRQRPPVPESSRPGPINTPGLSATGVGREGEPSTTETAAVAPDIAALLEVPGVGADSRASKSTRKPLRIRTVGGNVPSVRHFGGLRRAWRGFLVRRTVPRPRDKQRGDLRYVRTHGRSPNAAASELRRGDESGQREVRCPQGDRSGAFS